MLDSFVEGKAARSEDWGTPSHEAVLKHVNSLFGEKAGLFMRVWRFGPSK